MPYTVKTQNSYGWLHTPNTDDGLKPRLGLLTSEIAQIVGMDAISIRELMRQGRIPGVRLEELELVTTYAMTFSDIANHFPLTPDQKVQLRTYPLIGVVPSADNDYKHRLTFSTNEMSHVYLRTEFSTLDELKAENPQSFLWDFPESEWLD